MTVSPAPLRRMVARDPHESGRVASSLELFFDLVFVVAVSVASGAFHHQVAEGHVWNGLLHYLMAFFGIWWAWMNFTWFATSFDTDDWLYRVTTFVQMSGVLVLAAGIEPAFTDDDYRVLVLGYVVMRVAMVTQWLRAARAGGDHAPVARAYALGIAVVQVLWVGWLVVPTALQTVGFFALVLAELAVPVLAERRESTRTPWHPHHITERYSLFTLILLGESLLASANAVFGALHGEADTVALLAVALLAFTVTACLWWLYFAPEHHEAIGSLRDSLRYGYTHYFVFAAAGAFSVGVEVQVDRVVAEGTDGGHAALGAVASSFLVTVPIAVFLLGLWWVALRGRSPRAVEIGVPVAALLVLCDPLVPLPVAWTALVLVCVVVLLERTGRTRT